MELKEVKGINKYIGLMFNPFPKPLLFKFDTPINYPIHSFFCRSFNAYWYDEDNRLIEKRLIKPFKTKIKPNKPYSKLIEIPLNYKKNK